MWETGFQTQVLTYRCKITIHIRHLIIKRACEKQASRHKFLHIDVKSRYISAIFFIDETKRTRGDGFELKCSKTMCTSFKLYNVIITTRFVSVIACARQEIISARSGDTHKQTNKQTKSCSRTSMWGHIEELLPLRGAGDLNCGHLFVFEVNLVVYFVTSIFKRHSYVYRSACINAGCCSVYCCPFHRKVWTRDGDGYRLMKI